MAKIDKFNIDYILKWEGGLSKHQKDSASAFPVPDGSGYHTNKGITWRVWASVFGSSKESIKDFYEMPHDKWLIIFSGFWKGVKADLIEEQIIADHWADFAWGSGVSRASIEMQKFLNKHGYKVVVDGIVGRKTIEQLNKFVKDKGVKWAFEAMYADRVEFLQSLKSFKTFGTGWMRRMNDFYLYANKQIN
jgi:lysozyme family protein